MASINIASINIATSARDTSIINTRLSIIIEAYFGVDRIRICGNILCICIYYFVFMYFILLIKET